MKLRQFWMAAVFLILVAVIGAAIVGLFFLSGGDLSPGQEQSPEVQKPQPEEPLRVVVIDAGHGGEDGGAVGVTGLVEKDLNLDIAKRLAALLEKEGVRVVMTRSEDVLLYDRNTDYQGRKKALDLAARQAIGDQNPDGIFVSIHANTFSQQIYHGLQVWYSGNHPQSLALAESLRAEVVGTLQPENHRQSKKAGSNIYLLYHLQIPAVLVECGFLSNPTECRALEDFEYRQELAHALCRGIMAYYENDADGTKEGQTGS
ncbi:MAG: N-acetylmuramoyl-L-alanine amidase [Clostridia bacterium]|nr:N-acetylmuramoyl-L-alanine amidase [Clostridia bacterium]